MDPVADAIDVVHSQARKGQVRVYIGASGVGHPCDANLALSLRGFPDDAIDPQLNRIFREGHRLEDQVVKDLRAAGFLVFEKDHMTGRQFEYVAFGGHVKGHADGQVELDARWPGMQPGDMALLEIKSMNDQKWSKFVEVGVRASHPLYYWQMQMMMGLSGFQACLFVSYNKNNSKYASELVYFRDTDFAYLCARVQVAISNQARRVSEDEADWRCRGCFKRSACWGHVQPAKECRTCAHAAADDVHGWWCLKQTAPATAVCGDYEVYQPKPKL